MSHRSHSSPSVSSFPTDSLVAQLQRSGTHSVWRDLLTPTARAALLASATLAGMTVATMPQAAQAQISFDSGSELSSGFDQSSSSVGDFDGDDDLDLLVAGFSGSRTTTIYENTGQNQGSGTLDGNSFEDASAGLTGVSQSASAVGDFDGDGDLDLVVTGTEGSSYYGGGGPNTTIYENTDQNAGSGTLDGDTFSSIGAGLTGVYAGSVSVGDFDRDDDLDLLVTGDDESGQSATIYENTGGNAGDGTLDGTTFQEVTAGLTGVDESSSAVGDFDGDGDLDLLVTGLDEGANETATIYENTGQNQGSGILDGNTFDPISAGLIGVTDNSSSSVGDFDGDGDLDLLVTGSDGANSTATIYENTEDNAGSGTLDGNTFETVQALTGVKGSSSSVDDFDADDDLDLLITGRDNSDNYYATVYENTGNNAGSSTLDGSTFQDASAGLIGVAYGSSTVGDFDGDLDLDLLVTGDTGADGSGSLKGTIYDNTSNSPVPVELTSFAARRDGDGALLSWKTASEQNNAGFEVQRLVGEPGSGLFEPLGFVDGAGTTSRPHTYRFRADDLRAGTHRFRLKQVDTDGSVEYSETIPLEVTISETYRLSAPSPNPATDGTQIGLAVEQAQDVRVGVYDLMGREVAVPFHRTLPAHSERSIRVGTELPPGTYFIRVEGERFSATERLTVVK